MKRGASAGIALLALTVAVPASATYQPNLLYKPPLLRFFDYPTHMSVENVIVDRQGSYVGVISAPSPVANDLESDPGCESIPGGYKCPVAGLDRLVVGLGGLDDSVLVDLGAHARKIPEQVVRGGPGEDGLTAK